ncbi:hypothetical protein L596_001869 [Steinernema carpocapsae]|uniref:Uncharacterized protein n=1 Tax=Steinernema carpocapsae TaxID=34508 RepID=A0A4U8UMU5_STECR|nr:hypothetical protein L596_001869 [Steinernema carpocapsae]
MPSLKPEICSNHPVFRYHLRPPQKRSFSVTAKFPLSKLTAWKHNGLTHKHSNRKISCERHAAEAPIEADRIGDKWRFMCTYASSPMIEHRRLLCSKGNKKRGENLDSSIPQKNKNCCNPSR